jgi:hypothetical protein
MAYDGMISNVMDLVLKQINCWVYYKKYAIVNWIFSFPVDQQSKSGLGRLVLEIYRSHSDTPH